jgi:hypothetical protein
MENRRIANYTVVKLAVTSSADRHRELLSIVIGFRRFRSRGLSKAGGDWTLACLVHNTKQIYAKIRAKGGETDELTRELQAA